MRLAISGSKDCVTCHDRKGNPYHFNQFTRVSHEEISFHERCELILFEWRKRQ